MNKTPTTTQAQTAQDSKLRHFRVDMTWRHPRRPAPPFWKGGKLSSLYAPSCGTETGAEDGVRRTWTEEEAKIDNIVEVDVNGKPT